MNSFFLFHLKNSPPLARMQLLIFIYKRSCTSSLSWVIFQIRAWAEHFTISFFKLSFTHLNVHLTWGGADIMLMNPVLIYIFQVSVSKRFFSSHYPKLRCEHYSISTMFPLPLPPLRTQHVKIQKHPLWSPLFFLYMHPEAPREVKCCRHRSEHTLCHQTQQSEPWQLSPCRSWQQQASQHLLQNCICEPEGLLREVKMAVLLLLFTSSRPSSTSHS